MDQFILEWLNLIFRLAHIVTGIAWIGSSFYFMWLDSHLETTEEKDKEHLAGSLWSVHGGGFYNVKKYKVAPATLPKTLHWFKWEAYFTWITGFCLLFIVYYWNTQLYLIDTEKLDVAPYQAILIGLAFLGVGWVVYDLLCRFTLAKHSSVLALILSILGIGVAYILCSIFNSRGAYMHFGAMLGTIMAANVFFVIIPNQKKIVNALSKRKPVPVRLGIEGKMRSTHNNYLTLPVLFVMISNHYPFTFGAEASWIILIAISLAGALVRHYFNLRNQGKARLWVLIIVVVIGLGIVGYSYSTSSAVSTRMEQKVEFAQVKLVIQNRCITCHSQNPTFPGFLTPPKGIAFDTEQQIKNSSTLIYQQAVATKIMPPANLTKITKEERELIKQWVINFEHQQ